MSGLPILDLVVGMVFIFFLLSIIVSSAVEVVLTALKVRAKLLTAWLVRIFNEPSLLADGAANTKTDKKGNVHPVKLGEAIINHCITTVLSKKDRSTTYIKSSDFTNAFLDQVTRTTAGPSMPGLPAGMPAFQSPPASLQDYVTAITASPVLSGELKRTVIAMAVEASKTFAASAKFAQAVSEVKSDVDIFRTKLENWYDSNAERLIGKLKRAWAVPLTAVVATVMTVALNADTVAMGKYFYDNKEAAKTFADNALATYTNYKDKAERIQKGDTAPYTPADLKAFNAATQSLQRDVDSMKALLPAGFPIGYEREEWKDDSITKMSFFERLGYGPFWNEVWQRAQKHGAGWPPSSPSWLAPPFGLTC